MCVCVLNFYFAYLSLRHRTIFYIGTLLILMACACVRACVRAYGTMVKYTLRFQMERAVSPSLKTKRGGRGGHGNGLEGVYVCVCV